MPYTVPRCTPRDLLAIGVAAFTALTAIRPCAAADAAAPAQSGAATRLEVAHVDPAGAEKLISKNRQLIILDIRTPKEFAAGHIAGATNIDFNGSGFSTELSRLDRDRPYLLHCAVGGRSTRSLEVFRKLGFKSVTHLDGGLNAWEAAGRPVTTK